MEGGRNGSIHRLECLEDERVGGRGELDMMREGHVDEVDKEGGWKKGDTFILWGSRGEQVRVTRVGIGSHKLGLWDMDHCEVKICEVKEPAGLVVVKCLGFAEVD